MLSVRGVNNHFVATFVDTNRINAVYADKVKAELLKIVNRKKDLIIDLKGISFIDSTGFDTIVAVARTAKEKNIELNIVNLSKEVSELFELMKLDTILNLEYA